MNGLLGALRRLVSLRRKRTAEDLKRMMREYAEDNCPGWESAAAEIRSGELGEAEDFERLLIRPKD